MISKEVVKNKKRTGPSTHPWGIPAIIWFELDSFPTPTPTPSPQTQPTHFFSKSAWICSYCRNADRKTKALLKCSNSCLNRPLPQRCMFTKVRFSSLHENLCKITQPGNILSSQSTQHCSLSFSSLDARTHRICQRACLSPNCAHLRTYLPTQVCSAFMEPQSMKRIERVKCPCQHVQLLRKKLALLVWKEVHWHGSAFVLFFFFNSLLCNLFIYFWVSRKHCFFHFSQPGLHSTQ